MTLATLLAEVYRRCGYASSPASDVTTRITAFLNETQQELFSEPGMSLLLNDEILLPTFANQVEYALPQTVQRIKSIRDVTNRRKLIPLSLSTWRARTPDPSTDTGIPDYWINMGISPLALRLTVGQQVTVVSTSASDTNTAYLEGFAGGAVGGTGNSKFFSASVSMTGSTPANLGGTATENVTKFWLGTAAVGTVTLKNALAVNVSEIPIGATQPHYQTIALSPTPSSDRTYYLDFERTITDMTISTDEPILPNAFHRLLAIGARMKEYEKQNQMDRYTAANADFIRGKKLLKHWVHNQAVGAPNLRGYSIHNGEPTAINVTTS